MADVERHTPDGGTVTTDLLARARHLVDPGVPSPRRSAQPKTPWILSRRNALTLSLQHNAKALLNACLQDAFEEHGQDVAFATEETLQECCRQAIIEVCQRFGDWASGQDDVSDYLKSMNVPVPDEIGRDVSRKQTAVQRLCALALVVAADSTQGSFFSDAPINDELLLEVASLLTSIALGCSRGWDRRQPDLDAVVVFELLRRMQGWVEDPETIDVWANEVPLQVRMTFVSTPSDNLVLLRASSFLDEAYVPLFEHLDIDQ